jgi:hypothetical protein
MMNTPGIATVGTRYSLALLVALVTLGGVATAAGRGDCASVSMDEGFRLPDGSYHPAGVLTICERRSISPVASHHSIHVNGIPVTMLISRRGQSEGAAERDPFVMLLRDGEGRLHLYGYAQPAQDRMVTYQLVPGKHARAAVETALHMGGTSGEPTVMLVARAD